MFRKFIGALALLLAFSTSSLAQTTSFQVDNTAWVDLGTTPVVIRTTGQQPVLLNVDIVPPNSATAPATVLGPEEQQGFFFTPSGKHVYARALRGPSTVVAIPAAVGGGGGGGGGGGAVTPAVGAQELDLRGTQTLNAATLNQAVTVPINGQGTLGFAISGLTASGATLTFEQSEDGGTTWTIVNEINAGTGAATSTRTTDGQSRIAASGRTNLRARVSAVGTGTITVVYNVSVTAGMVTVASPVNIGQYNSTLPTLASGQYTVMALDANGRVLLSPTSALSVTVADGADVTQGAKADTQATDDTGSWSVVAILKRISAALRGTIKTDGSATTQPVSAAALPLPAGAATATNQTSEISALGAPGDTAYAGTGSASLVAALKGVYNATLAPIVGTDGTTNRAISTTTGGSLAPPVAPSGKITKTSTALTASTSTTVAAANANRIALAIQCGSGGVSVDETGGALTAAGVGNGTLFIPANAGAYFTPPVATLTAVTAYTATAQTCVVTEYLR